MLRPVCHLIKHVLFTSVNTIAIRVITLLIVIARFLGKHKYDDIGGKKSALRVFLLRASHKKVAENRLENIFPEHRHFYHDNF